MRLNKANTEIRLKVTEIETAMKAVHVIVSFRRVTAMQYTSRQAVYVRPRIILLG